MLRNPVSPPVSAWRSFVGQTVALAYNLNVCPGGNRPEPPPGTPCWTVRAVSSGRDGGLRVKQTDILGYVPEALLRDCTFYIDRTRLASKREQGKKDAFAYIVGTVVPLSPSPAGLPTQWTPLGFDPLGRYGPAEDSFKLVTPSGRKSVERLGWFFGSGRKALASLSGVRSNPVVTVDDLREVAETLPPLTDV